MGLTDWINNANNQIGQLIDGKVAVPVPATLINAYLSKIEDDALNGIEKLHSVHVVLQAGYFEIIADITQNGIRAAVRLELEVINFRADFADHGTGELVLRQRKTAEIQGKGWRDRLTVLVAKAIIAVAANATLEAWTLGKVPGISVDGQTYTFDLDMLGVREKLLQGILAKLGAKLSLVEKALKWAAASYSLTGATCTEGALVLELSKNET